MVISRVAGRSASRRASVDFPAAIFPQTRYNVVTRADSIAAAPGRTWAQPRSRRSVSLHRQALFLHQRLQFTGLEHLAHDVAAADELALDVELRDGRPVRIALDAVPQFLVLEHVEAFVGHTEMVEDL